MGFEADETVWRPGRIHTGATDVEDEVAGMFAAVANGAVTEADLSPRAALHPQNFAQGASIGAPTWNAHRVTVPLNANGWQIIGGEFDCGMIRRPLTRLWARVGGPDGCTAMVVELHEITQAGVDGVVASFSFDPTAVPAADIAVASVTIARWSRLYVRVNSDAATTIRHILVGARLRRYWIN